MTEGKEVHKAICKTLVEISMREKEKAIESGIYEDALVASFLEGLFKEAEKSL